MFMLADATIPQVPPMDRFGLPGHWAIFLLLYHVTFVLHFLFMNFSLGGTLICLVNDVRGLWRPADRDYLIDLNRRIYLTLPVALSFAITFGVAPLLFVQVLYGQFFYTANILVGLPWMGIIAVLIVVFYLIYVMRFGPAAARPGQAGLRVAISLVVFLGFAAVAFLLTSNAVWSIVPQAWQGRYDAGGLNPWPPEGHFLPRYLHNLIGATAVACVLLAATARVLRRRGVVGDDWAARTVGGMLLAAAALTVLQMIDGATMVALLRRSVRDGVLLFSFKNVHAWGWRIGIASAIGALVFMIRGAREPRNGAWPWVAVLFAAGTLGGMSMAREAVRAAYLADVFQLTQWQEKTHWQTSPLIVFLVSFVAALGAIAWMLWVSWKIPPQIHHRQAEPDGEPARPAPLTSEPPAAETPP